MEFIKNYILTIVIFLAVVTYYQVVFTIRNGGG